MKALIISVFTLIGVIIGMYPSLSKPKPLWWKILAVFLVTAAIAMNLLPAVGGSWSEFIRIKNIDPTYVFNVEVLIDQKPVKSAEGWFIKGLSSDNHNVEMFFAADAASDAFNVGNTVICKLKYNSESDMAEVIGIESVNPWITLPYIPQFDQKIKIMNFHVAVAWVSVVAYLLSMIYSVQYLRKRDYDYDIKASSAASIGFMFTLLATITGAIWAKFNWGSYWNWDPRETSIFILLLIYGAYFALRSALDRDEIKARLSSVYSIIAFVTVPFLVFVIPRITSSLHPGSADEVNSGPILSGQTEMLNQVMQYTFGFSLMAFTVVFFWMFNLVVRSKKLEITILNK